MGIFIEGKIHVFIAHNVGISIWKENTCTCTLSYTCTYISV